MTNRWSLPTQDQQHEKMGRGREAGLVLQVANPIFDEAFEGMIDSAMARYKKGALTPELALVFVASLVAVYDVRQELIDRMKDGEQAANEIHGQPAN